MCSEPLSSPQCLLADSAFNGYEVLVLRLCGVLVLLSRPPPSSKCPWKCPDLLAAPVFIELTLHSWCLIKRLLAPEPNRSGPPLQRRTRCVINGKQLQWRGDTFNKVENVYPIKPMQRDGVSHHSNIPHYADKDVYALKKVCIFYYIND